MTLRLPIASSTLPSALPPSAEGVAVSSGELLKVGELAERTQKTVRALHLYEELGLLAPSERSKGGFRLYGPDAVLRVKWISRLQDMGFSLPDIREIVQRWAGADTAVSGMSRIRTIYREKLEDTERQLQRLEELKAELRASIAYLESCDECHPARLVTACPRCELHGCGAPELVAGLHSHKQP